MSWHDARRVRLRALFARRDLTGRPDLPMLSVYRDYGVVPREGRDDNYNKPGEHPGRIAWSTAVIWSSTR